MQLVEINTIISDARVFVEKKKGVFGLQKGRRKAVLGLMLYPTSGLIDLTSAILAAVQKSATHTLLHACCGGISSSCTVTTTKSLKGICNMLPLVFKLCCNCTPEMLF